MKNRFQLSWISFGLLFGAAMFASQAISADSSAQQLIATALQDEARKLPEDNIAYFTRADRRVRFQLVKFSGASSDMLAGTNVTVVNPSGESSTITADEQGVATLEDPVPGLYALAATDERGHVAVPIAVREGQPPVVADLPSPDTIPPVKLAMMDVNPKEVLRFTSSYLPPEMGESAIADIDTDYVISGGVVTGLQYRVRLGDDGTLDGQVYSLLQNGLTTYGVGGTTIAIFKGNRLIARTVADDAGHFSVGGMKPGVFGLFAGGPAGYAGFGFETYDAEAVASNGLDGETLVSTTAGNTKLTAKTLAPGTTLPVVLIPPSMLPAVIDSIRDVAGIAGPDGIGGGPGFPGAAGVGPGGIGPGGVAGGIGPGGFGGGIGGAAGGVGGIGGLGGLLAAGGIIAAGIAVAENNDNNNNNVEIISP